jgi:hypothetical protein
MDDLKASLIRQTEQAIDVLRKDQERMQAQLNEIEPKLIEARAMLRMLRMTTPESSAINGKRRRDTTSPEEARLALDEMGALITGPEFAELLDISAAAGSEWCKKFVREGLLEKVSTGSGGKRSVYRKVASE